MRSTSKDVPDGRLGRILFTCDWHRNFHRHALRWTIARVERNADARKTDLRKKRHGQRKTCNRSGKGERCEQKENETRMAVRPRTTTHFLISTAMPSSS